MKAKWIFVSFSVLALLTIASLVAFYSLRNRVADRLEPLLFARGTQLAAEDVGKLEQELKSDSNSFAKRIELLAYYSFKEKTAELTTEEQAKRREHIFWVIRHEPTSKFAGSNAAAFDAVATDPEGVKEGKTLWLEQVQKNARDAQILFNAGQFLWWADDTDAQGLLERAYALNPTDREIASSLAGVYWRSARHALTTEQIRSLAIKALPVFETALQDAQNAQERLYDLPDAAQAAFEAGDESRAATYSNEALKLAEQPEYQENNADAIHYGNIVLGRIAIKHGDLAGASKHLIKAGAIQGNPHLDTFGPNMMLAKEVLERGERKSVLTYFDLCAKFWTQDEGKLNQWRTAVLNGNAPDFGANLRY